uniref:EamA family transporter RarD n=1 Tax=uncultured Allobacillus sp. TaxID=1638025 RepID=UPI0025957686|nr:EamA family transporter RarD [uncultured Allobacillus sp.]
MNEERIGILYGFSAYLLWGFLPLYWKLVESVPAWEVLAHRVIWSFVFMLCFILFIRRWQLFKEESKYVFSYWKRWLGILVASILISLNWVTYIWAVNAGHVLDASLGYYINPLFNVVLGILFLQEKLSPLQWIAVFSAFIGVSFMTVHFGSVPWVAIVLAMTFGLYGFLKKVADLNPIFALGIETMFITPIALIYLSIIEWNGTGSFSFDLVGVFLFGTGAITAIPLLLFAQGAKRIPLSLIGFLQYLAPTIMLLIGVFLLNETFTYVHAVTFLFIWVGLILYTYERYRGKRQQRALTT